MKRNLLIASALLMTACGLTGGDGKNRPETASAEAATPVVYADTVALAAPPEAGGLTIDEALHRRASWRTYGDEPLTLEELSGVLWAAAGINRPEENRLTAPSALALYPIRVYAFTAAGIYRYEAAQHRLVRIVEGDRRAAAGAQPFVGQAQLNLVYVADRSVYEGKPIPPEQVRYLCGQDAAGYAENVNLYAAGHGLKSITRGSTSPELPRLLGLDEERCFIALAQSVGK